MTLKDCRERSNLLIKEICARMDIHRNTYASWERDISHIPGKRVIQLAEILECSADDILGIKSDEALTEKEKDLIAKSFELILEKLHI